MSDERKTRGDSELDIRLSDAEQDVFFAFVERNTLKEAKRWLHEHKLLDLSEQAISAWAAKRRKTANDFKFQQLLTQIREDNEMAVALGVEIGDAASLNDANVLLLSQALFEAKRSRDPRAVKASAKLFSMVLEANAKAKAAQAAVISAETSRDRFQFDAAKSALAHAATLKQITESSGNEREKIERAVETLFGRRPANPALGFAGASDDVRTGSPAKGTDVRTSNNDLTSDVRKGVEA